MKIYLTLHLIYVLLFYISLHFSKTSPVELLCMYQTPTSIYKRVRILILIKQWLKLILKKGHLSTNHVFSGGSFPSFLGGPAQPRLVYNPMCNGCNDNILF